MALPEEIEQGDHRQLHRNPNRVRNGSAKSKSLRIY